MKSIIRICILILITVSCEEADTITVSDSDTLPDHIAEMENLTVISPEKQPFDTVELVREQVFESNEDVFIKGYIGKVAVDDRDRVYIVGNIPGTVELYVFEPNGEYVTTIGRHGKGPGEFLVLSGMAILGDRLYAYDNHQKKITVFSLNDFTLTEDFMLRHSRLAQINSGSDLHVSREGGMIMDFNRSLFESRKSFYLKISDEGEVLADTLLEVQEHQLYHPGTSMTSDGYIRVSHGMPFSAMPLVGVSREGKIYSAWSAEFLITLCDEDGKYLGSFYLPYQQSDLDISEGDWGESREMLFEENPELIPDNWPALHTIEVDDENRLWVSTITDSDSTFQWWVLDEKGTLLARFERAGERESINAGIPPTIIIKNGYFYSRERDLREGIDRIVKSKIVFKSR